MTFSRPPKTRSKICTHTCSSTYLPTDLGRINLCPFNCGIVLRWDDCYTFPRAGCGGLDQCSLWFPSPSSLTLPCAAIRWPRLLVCKLILFHQRFFVIFRCGRPTLGRCGHSRGAECHTGPSHKVCDLALSRRWLGGATARSRRFLWFGWWRRTGTLRVLWLWWLLTRIRTVFSAG